jgi:ribosomal protein S27AE
MQVTGWKMLSRPAQKTITSNGSLSSPARGNSRSTAINHSDRMLAGCGRLQLRCVGQHNAGRRVLPRACSASVTLFAARRRLRCTRCHIVTLTIFRGSTTCCGKFIPIGVLAKLNTSSSNLSLSARQLTIDFNKALTAITTTLQRPCHFFTRL